MLIGIAGGKGSGKDTFAAAEIFKDFEKLSFAKVIKEAMVLLFDMGPTELHGTQEEKEVIMLDDEGNAKWKLNGKDASPRMLMQWFGTEVLRNNICEDFLVKKVEDSIMKLRKLSPDVGIVITDVRFDNEAEFVRKLGGKVVRIDREIANTSDTHASEKGLLPENIDVVISNNDTIEDLHKKAIDFVEDYDMICQENV